MSSRRHAGKAGYLIFHRLRYRLGEMLFCRHNRPTSKCSICSRELEDQLRAKAPKKPRATGKRASASSSRSASKSRRAAVRNSRQAGPLVTKKLSRAVDDGYRDRLTPGIRSSVDAERLAAAIVAAARRLEYPGPYPQVADQSDVEVATFLAFLLVCVGENASELPGLDSQTPQRWAEDTAEELPERWRQTVVAYGEWIERSGSQEAAFTGEQSWSPSRRFERIFERLAFPGFDRAKRFELLAILGAAEIYSLEAYSLHIPADDPTSIAAKRIFGTADKMALERRSKELAEAHEVRLAALDYAFILWGDPGWEPEEGTEEEGAEEGSAETESEAQERQSESPVGPQKASPPIS